MTGAHGYSEAVKQRAHVEMMDAANVETDYSVMRILIQTINFDAIYPAELLHAV